MDDETLAELNSILTAIDRVTARLLSEGTSVDSTQLRALGEAWRDVEHVRDTLADEE